jgi:hypothetical protein
VIQAVSSQRPGNVQPVRVSASWFRLKTHASAHTKRRILDALRIQPPA